MGAVCPCPPVRNNILTPRHLFFYFFVLMSSLESIVNPSPIPNTIGHSGCSLHSVADFFLISQLFIPSLAVSGGCFVSGEGLVSGGGAVSGGAVVFTLQTPFLRRGSFLNIRGFVHWTVGLSVCLWVRGCLIKMKSVNSHI